MAFNLQRLLIEGEEVLYQTRVSYWDRFWTIAIGVVLIPLFALGFFVIYYAQLVCQNSILVVTNKRVIAKRGIFNTEVLEFPLNKIESIAVKQGYTDSLMEFGSVIISGTGGDRTPIEAILAPQDFQKEFHAAVNKENNKQS